MTVTLIDASPKAKDSTSGKLLNIVKEIFSEEITIREIKLFAKSFSEEQKNILKESDGIIFSFPLYVDGIPGHLLSCMKQAETENLIKQNAYVYGIVNCGFYEGIQAENALMVMENWCYKIAVPWGGGVGIGGGGAMDMIPMNTPNGPIAPVWKELEKMCVDIETKRIGENCFTQIKFPRFLYKMGGQMGWKKMIKKNNLKVSDLNKRL